MAGQSYAGPPDPDLEVADEAGVALTLAHLEVPKPSREQAGEDLPRQRAATCTLEAVSTSRIAYLGPTPTLGTSGPSECAWLILEQLAASGVQLDCYLTFTDERQQLDTVAKLPGTAVISVGSRWRWNRWYSRSGLMATLTGLGAQALGRRRLVKLLVKQHELVPYDVVYQFSTIESFGRRSDKRRLPPVVLHPSAHAAGELHWMFQERELSRHCEGWLRPTILMGWFFVRSRRQRRDIGRAAAVLALSENFARDLVEDYRVKADRVRVVPNPINLEAFRPATESFTGTPVQIAMVGRISVRKGVELVVELSHRIADLAGSVHLTVFGNHSQWSDYRALLKDLSPEVASYGGRISRANLLQELPTWDLLLQPAKYEPFGLTVGEALACGVPAVVTTAVGAGESVSGECCKKVAVGDIDALEHAVREMVARLQSPERGAVRLEARRQAERLWSATRVADLVETALSEVSAWSTSAAGAARRSAASK